jgi:hypothetical protein
VAGAQVTYRPGADATSEEELRALAAIYRFILDCQAKKTEGGPATAPNDAERRSNEIGAESKYTNTRRQRRRNL